MIKSIVTSKEARVRKQSNVKRDFSTVLNNIPAMTVMVDREIQKYENKQTISQKSAALIRSK